MDISGIDVCELPFDEVVVLQSETEAEASASNPHSTLYESPGYPAEIGSYSLIEVAGVLHREDISANGGYIYAIVDKSDLERIGLI